MSYDLSYRYSTHNLSYSVYIYKTVIALSIISPIYLQNIQYNFKIPDNIA